VQNDAFHGRVSSIPLVFQAAAADLAAQAAEQAAEQVVEAAEQAAEQSAKAAGQQQAAQGAQGRAAAAAAAAAVTAEVVRAVWARLLPGLLERYDGPASLALIAPRPLLVATGELDPRCPLEVRGRERYRKYGMHEQNVALVGKRPVAACSPPFPPL
jgi:hypothetical protein